LARHAAAPRVQQRTFAAAARASVRAGAVQASKPAFAPRQQVRGVKTIDFAGSKEDVYGKFEL
jgi:ketol-acid reductoisomerase